MPYGSTDMYLYLPPYLYVGRQQSSGTDYGTIANFNVFTQPRTWMNERCKVITRLSANPLGNPTACRGRPNRNDNLDLRIAGKPIDTSDDR